MAELLYHCDLRDFLWKSFMAIKILGLHIIFPLLLAKTIKQVLLRILLIINGKTKIHGCLNINYSSGLHII